MLKCVFAIIELILRIFKPTNRELCTA